MVGMVGMVGEVVGGEGVPGRESHGRQLVLFMNGIMGLSFHVVREDRQETCEDSGQGHGRFSTLLGGFAGFCGEVVVLVPLGQLFPGNFTGVAVDIP
jgi:hypothetical protein